MNVESGSGTHLPLGNTGTGASPGHHTVSLTLSGCLSRFQLQEELLRQQFVKVYKTITKTKGVASK